MLLGHGKYCIIEREIRHEVASPTTPCPLNIQLRLDPLCSNHIPLTGIHISFCTIYCSG